MTADITVGLVGLGTIAETHLAVLASIPEVSLAFAVDPEPNKTITFAGTDPPCYRGLHDALGNHQPDLVVITSPTSTHAELSEQVLTESHARLLVEKPLVHDLHALARLRTMHSTSELHSRVFVAHHFAFSPEVRWGAHQIATHPEWGPVTRITCSFHDAYIVDSEHSFSAYVSSWVDSGVNQLSMLARFVDIIDRGRLHETDNGASSWCTATFQTGGRDGQALLRASWQAVASSKRSTLYLDETDVEIWLDHTALTGVIARNGNVQDHLVDDGLTPRKIAHYQPLYRSLLSDNPDPILGFTTAERIVELLYR